MWDGPMATGVHGNTLSPAPIKAFRKRMGLEYVDIFITIVLIPKRRFSKETMKALGSPCAPWQALYVGISNYPADPARQAIDILEDPARLCLIHQPSNIRF